MVKTEDNIENLNKDDKALLMSVAALSIQGASSVKDDLLIHAATAFIKEDALKKAENVTSKISDLNVIEKAALWDLISKAYLAEGDLNNASRVALNLFKKNREDY